MIKIAQLSSAWQNVYQKLKNPPQGINLGSFPSRLPPINKIVLDPGRLPDKPQAIGYVSTEDANQDGKLDTVHLSIPRLEEAMRQAGFKVEDLQKINNLPPEDVKNILSVFVEVLSHELGHLKDYKPQQENVFPGGESAAESAARSAVNQISLATTNKKVKNERESFKMGSKKTKEVLTKLANDLDAAGAIEVADKVDGILISYAEFVGRLEPEIEGEQPASAKPVPMGERYQNLPVSQTDGVITDTRVKPAPEDVGARTRASAVRFKEDVGVEPGHANENIGKVQQALLDAGYSIGKGLSKPDLDWGPVSTQSWTRFHTDYLDLLRSQGFTPEQIQQQVHFFDTGVIGNILGLFDAYQRVLQEGGQKLWQEFAAVPKEQQDAWKQANPAKYQQLISYLKFVQHKKQQIEGASPIAPEAAIPAEKYLAQQTKASADADAFYRLLKQEKHTPFGR